MVVVVVVVVNRDLFVMTLFVTVLMVFFVVLPLAESEPNTLCDFGLVDLVHMPFLFDSK